MLQFRIGCIDGNMYESDPLDEGPLQQYLDDNNGRIGAGDFADVVISTVDDFVKFLTDGLSGYDIVKGAKMTNFTMEIDGRERTFIRDKVVWFEVIRD